MQVHADSYSTSVPGMPGQYLAKTAVRVERVVFSNEESGYAVLRVRPNSGGQGFTMKGIVGDMHEGATVKVAGKWTETKYGTQLEVGEIDLPDLSGEGVLDFLKAGFVKGVGLKLADELWEHFGMRLHAVLENESHRLTEVKGIGKTKAEVIKESWDEAAGKREALCEFQKLGLHVGIVRQLFNLWPAPMALRVVRENPYMLLWKVSGVGFLTADHIAMKLGIPQDSMMRLSAALHYVLDMAEQEGHCYLPEDDLLRKTLKELMLDVPLKRLEEALDWLEVEEQISREAAPGAEGEFLVYRKVTHVSEITLAKHLRRIAAHEKKAVAGLDEAFDAFEKKRGISSLHHCQREALKMAFENPVCVITGGPGTGKTMIIRAIIEISKEKTPKKRISLCAPTGRAAKRMAESTGMDASTIHRLLGFSPDEGFGFNMDNPLPTDMLICDESSMLDVHLARALVSAIRSGTSLVFVGDVNQLPSVGPGNVLRDIIKSGTVPTVTLEQVYRQSQGSYISLNAAAVLRGDFDDIQFSGTDDFFWAGIRGKELQPEEKAEAITTLLTMCVERLLELNHKAQDIQVLCPMRKGKLGVTELNKVLQRIYNPGATPFFVGKERQFCIGDRVMQTKNNYDKDVFNGDQGVIVSATDKEAVIDFDGRLVTYPRQDLGEITLSYAMTVHKSQGSESRAVILVLAKAHYMMLQRSILYTGITRARERCVLIGEKAAVKMAVSSNNVALRNTCLETRLLACAV